MESSTDNTTTTLITVSEAARHLGVSAASLRLWSDKGRLPVFRTPGGQRRFRPGDVQEFLESMRQPVEPQEW